MLISFVLFGAACEKRETSAANTENSNAAVFKTNTTFNQTTESVSNAERILLKPSDEPCGWFKESLKLPAKKYEQSPTMPNIYHCVQVKLLINQSNFEYHVVGDAEKVKYLYFSIHPGARNDIKQDAQLQNMLTLAVQDALEKVSGQKLGDEITHALLVSETREFTLEPGADKTKPQVKTVAIKKEARDGRVWKYVKGITLNFE